MVDIAGPEEADLPFLAVDDRLLGAAGAMGDNTFAVADAEAGRGIRFA